MATRWTTEAVGTLGAMLLDNRSLSEIKMKITDRSDDAIVAKAKKMFNYGEITIDGEIRFYPNMKNRKGGKRRAATNDVQVSVAASVPILRAEPRRIISHDALFANSLAIKFLVENNLSTDPKIIYEQSLLILKGLV